jgi:dTDP-4-amino-4,6-dideoxygalactose transaminase
LAHELVLISFREGEIMKAVVLAEAITNSILPITEDVAEREVTLPLYPSLRDEDVVLIAKTIQKAVS